MRRPPAEPRPPATVRRRPLQGRPSRTLLARGRAQSFRVEGCPRKRSSFARRGMGTQSVAEMTAAEPRERLVAFVRELVAGLPLARQRENALVYTRGLVEHGGRKSLQPTLFRLGASTA